MSASYYAVNAKVRALYGRRMTAEDYRLLQEKRTIPEAAAFLQAHPGYRDRLSGLNTVSMHREMLEIALRCSYVDEYRRIFSFMSLTDKELMRFPVYKAEHAVILANMRRLTSNHMLDYVSEWDVMLQNGSAIDMPAIHAAKTFQEIAQAAAGTIYGSALIRIASADSGIPSSAFVDNMMQVVYYAKLYKATASHYTGDTKKLLRLMLDEETDLMNLVQFLRLKRYFPPEDIKLYSFPLPCSAKLKQEFIQQLISSPDYDSAFEMIRNSPYGNLFRSIESSGVEAYLYTLQYNFAKRQLRSASPTVYTPIAYLTLKEIELRNIISIVECIRYGGNPNEYVTLIGV